MHPHQYNSGPGGGGPGADMKGGFATCAAAMVSILITPIFAEYTMPYVIWLAEDHYERETVGLIAFAWDIIAWPMTFFAARAAIGAALTMAGVYLAYRLI
ncbi:hypothetical protein [Ruegeria sp. EL01]|uniref:hypothetical protein n=1 Tax=Ruegeria sp. EL01 TaxID=2107578 RepID=UPI0013C49E14|nr:hypothetical protein [Ruegeria sp. EL01]